MNAAAEYFGPSTKKSRGIATKTRQLRDNILAVAATMDPPFTVRQMFYQLSSRGLVRKTEKQGYRPVQRQLVDMRRSGEIPYDWIADNTRWMRKPASYSSLGDFLGKWANHYRADLWHKADSYVEIWCEKDALAGVIFPVTAKYDVRLMVSRGYSSESFAYEAAEHIRAVAKPAFIYYVGDFDPSGWQMSQDLEDKLSNFGADVRFIRLGMNEEHIHMNEYQNALRPSKTTDRRVKGFFEEFGKDTPSLELDAAHPDTLRAWIQNAIERHIEPGELAALEREEAAAREVLRELALNGFE